MILYHFPTSPFARRVRLALAHKGLSAELRDARGNPEHRAELQRLNPFHTVPVLVDEDLVLLDSMAICHYLDRKVPDPPLVPTGVEGALAFQLIALTDGVANALVDLGMRYHPIHGDPHFPEVRELILGRAQRALEVLATKVGARGNEPLCGAAWSLADMAVYCLVTWLEQLPERAPTFPPAKHMVDLGWTVPAELSSWAARQRQRPEANSGIAR